MLNKDRRKSNNVNNLSLCPTSEKGEEEIEEFYEKFEKTINENRCCYRCNVLMGDFDSKIGKGVRVEDLSEPYG